MRRLLPFLLVLSLVVTTLVLAQAGSSSINGAVKDSSGSVLPGATVEISSDALSGRTRSTVTDNKGEYRFSNLDAGVYTLRFTLTRFTTLERRGFQLLGDFNARVDAS